MALRVGIDLVDVAAVADSLRGAHRDHYLHRVYTEREVATAAGPSRVEPERLAARFAAKEATMKALRGRVRACRLRRSRSSAPPTERRAGARRPRRRALRRIRGRRSSR